MVAHRVGTSWTSHAHNDRLHVCDHIAILLCAGCCAGLVEQVEAVWDEVEAELCLEVEQECGAAV